MLPFRNLTTKSTSTVLLTRTVTTTFTKQAQFHRPFASVSVHDYPKIPLSEGKSTTKNTANQDPHDIRGFYLFSNDGGNYDLEKSKAQEKLQVEKERAGVKAAESVQPVTEVPNGGVATLGLFFGLMAPVVVMRGICW